MPKAGAVFQLIYFAFVCVRGKYSTYYTEHGLRKTKELPCEVSTMRYDNDGDNLSSLFELDQDKLQLLRERAEVRRVLGLVLTHKDLLLI